MPNDARESFRGTGSWPLLSASARAIAAPTPRDGSGTIRDRLAAWLVEVMTQGTVVSAPYLPR